LYSKRQVTVLLRSPLANGWIVWQPKLTVELAAVGFVGLKNGSSTVLSTLSPSLIRECIQPSTDPFYKPLDVV
jgi:hypothetical protein